MTAGDGRAAAVAARIEEAVRGWRERNPEGTVRDMLAVIGGRFPGQRSLLKVELWITDLHSAGRRP